MADMANRYDDSIDPLLLQAMAQAGIAPDKLDALKNQIDIAQALKYQSGPESRAYNGVYRAASPLEFLGKGLESYQASKRLGTMPNAAGVGGSGLYGQRDSVSQQKAQAMQMYMAYLLKKMQQPKEPVPGYNSSGDIPIMMQSNPSPYSSPSAPSASPGGFGSGTVATGLPGMDQTSGFEGSIGGKALGALGSKVGELFGGPDANFMQFGGGASEAGGGAGDSTSALTAGGPWAALAAAILAGSHGLDKNHISGYGDQLKGNTPNDILHSQNWQNHVPDLVSEELQPYADLHGLSHLQDFPEDMWKATKAPWEKLRGLF